MSVLYQPFLNDHNIFIDPIKILDRYRGWLILWTEDYMLKC